MALGRAIGRGTLKAGGIAGYAIADVAGALPLLAGAGLIGAGMAKGWGGKSDKDKEDKSGTIAKTPLMGESATEAARKILEKILVEVEGIHKTLKDRVVPESLKKELRLDALTRHRELIASIMHGKSMTKGTHSVKETWWDKLKKFMSWILNPKTWAKALKVGGGIVAALLLFVKGIGAFFLSPAGIALLAVLVVAINWRKIKATIRKAIKSIKVWGKWILTTIGLGFLVDTSVDHLADEDDPSPDMGMDDTIGEEDVGRASSNYGILKMLDAYEEEVPLNIIIRTGADELSEVQRDDNVFGSDEEADKFLDDVMAGKKPDKESEVTGNVFATGAAADNFLQDTKRKSLKERWSDRAKKQVELKATMQNQIAASGLTTKQIVDEIQPQTPLVDRGTYSYFDSYARKGGSKVNAEEMYGREREVTVFDGSPQPKQSRKDTTPKTYNEGWQINKGGGWEDVADQKVPTIMGEKGLSTLSHVRYRQKEGSPSVGSTSQTSMPSTSTAAASLSASSGSSNMQANLASIFKSVIPNVSAQVTTGGNEVQLGMTIAGVGRIGSRTIIRNTNVDTSSTFASSSGSTQTTQQGMSVNNNHTQPPQQGRDA